MKPARRPGPDAASTPAEFIIAMRQLKAWSALTYRQLERRATAAGDRLPRSTVATVLNRGALPRERMLTAFVRACGVDAGEVSDWIRVCRTLAAPVPSPPPPDRPAPVEPEPQPITVVPGDSRARGRRTPGVDCEVDGPSPRHARARAGRPMRVVAVVGAVVVAMGLVAVIATRRVGEPAAAPPPSEIVAQPVVPSDVPAPPPPPVATAPPTPRRAPVIQPKPSPSASPSARPSLAGTYGLRPGHNPEFCVNREWVSRRGEDVATQAPCAQRPAEPTRIVPLGDGTYQLQWHPALCLGVERASRDDLDVIVASPCTVGGAHRLRVEPVDASTVRLRMTHSDKCLSVQDGTRDTSWLVQQACVNRPHQAFRLMGG